MKLPVKGFTLVELLLATAILVFVLVGLLALFINCIFLNESSRNLTVATGHAQYAMEEIKNTDFNLISSNYNGICWDSATLQAKGLSALNNENICMNVSGTNMLDVLVTATWKDRGTRNRNLTLETLIIGP